MPLPFQAAMGKRKPPSARTDFLAPVNLRGDDVHEASPVPSRQPLKIFHTQEGQQRSEMTEAPHVMWPFEPSDEE